jgi:hypothetical protein
MGLERSTLRFRRGIMALGRAGRTCGRVEVAARTDRPVWYRKVEVDEEIERHKDQRSTIYDFRTIAIDGTIAAERYPTHERRKQRMKVENVPHSMRPDKTQIPRNKGNKGKATKICGHESRAAELYIMYVESCTGGDISIATFKVLVRFGIGGAMTRYVVREIV